MSHPFTLLACLAFIAPAVHSVFTIITSAAEFVAFADEVNSGTGYSGSTVTLTRDIDFTGVNFSGVGTSIYSTSVQNPFRGTFDGNGHVVSNMHLYSAEATYLGLFSLVNGGVIKGIVVDSSCSVDNNVTAYYTYSAGIVANAVAGSTFKMYDCVNMATVTGIGTGTNIGGVVGCLYAFSSPATVYNCVNFGDISNSGTGGLASAGGIVGWMSQGESYSATSTVHNCVNLGTVTGATENVGAIAGLITATMYTIKNAFWVSGSSAMPFPSSATAETSEALGADFSVSGGKFLADVMNAYVDTVTDLPLRRWGKVTFNTNGGSSVNPKTSFFVVFGTPEIPTRTGYGFGGWYMGPELEIKWTPQTIFSGDAPLYAKWIPNKYTVTFNTNGGSPLGPITSDYSSTIPLPTPTRTGYTFTSWTDDKGNTFTFNYTINRAENVTLTAQWTPNNYTVTFNTNGGDSLNESERTKGVTYDQQYGDLPEPTRTGHSFNGWFTEGGGESVTSETIVTTPYDHTLTAQWSVNQYTVTFDFDNGTVYERIFAFNETIVYPENLTKEGYTFLGWDNAIERMPAEDVVIRALWSLNNYTVLFDFGNGTVAEELVVYGDLIEYPENPEKIGYSFNGWDNVIERMPAEDVAIKAIWSLNNYTVTFDFDDGTTTVKIIEYNGPIEYPENPKREGYIFAGWDSSITSMPAEDITIKALWSELSTEYVEIVFGKKDMTEGEIHKIISKYAQDDSYEIKVFEAEDESTRVIVKFVDAEDASLFYRSVKMSSERGFVRSIKFTDETAYIYSFTAGILPLGASLLFMLF